MECRRLSIRCQGSRNTVNQIQPMWRQLFLVPHEHADLVPDHMGQNPKPREHYERQLLWPSVQLLQQGLHSAEPIFRRSQHQVHEEFGT